MVRPKSVTNCTIVIPDANLLDRLDVVSAPAARTVPVLAAAPVVLETMVGKYCDFVSDTTWPAACAPYVADPIRG